MLLVFFTSLLWAALARCGRSSHIQAWSDSVQVLAWPGTGLSVWAVYTGRSSCWTTASLFRQPPSTRCSTVSARYVRPSHLRCRWTNDMELVQNNLREPDMQIDCFRRTLKTCLFDQYCRSGEEQSHKSPTPGGGPDEYHRAVSLFSFILRTHLAYDVSTNLAS